MALEKQIPKVSVCVITYNQEKYIRQCLQSIVDQNTNFDFEVIVGEDCSTDGTRAILLEFESNYPTIFKLILYDSNVGGCNNYRSVHSAARGEYIAQLDGDDYWHQDKLQSQIDFMECNKNCSAVYTNAWVESDSGETIGVFSSGVKSFFDLSYLIKSGNFLANSSTLYRKKYREYVIPSSGEFVDFLVHIRLALRGQLGFIDKNLVSYTHRSTTSVIRGDNRKVRLLIWDALEDPVLQTTELQTTARAKLIFVAESITFELLHGSREKVAMWTAKLTNKSHDGIYLTKLKIFSFVGMILANKVLNRFLINLKNNNEYYIFFKK